MCSQRRGPRRHSPSRCGPLHLLLLSVCPQLPLCSPVSTNPSTSSPLSSTLLSVCLLSLSVKVRAITCRALKDKVPWGDYVLRVSVRETLGGTVIPWRSGGSSQRWEDFTSTAPTAHGGSFTDVDLAFQQHVFLTVPPDSERRPANIFVFELVLQQGPSSPAGTRLYLFSLHLSIYLFIYLLLPPSVYLFLFSLSASN